MNTPVLPEILVNAFSVGNQSTADVTVLSDGRIIVTWQSDGQDGDGPGIIAQAFTAQGERLGIEFVVNDSANGAQTLPSIAATDDGGFVVAWQSPDGSGDGIFTQRYGADLAPVGPETRVNDNISSTQTNVSVSAVPGGGYVATWYDEGSGPDFFDDVRAQIFDASGAPVGSIFTVNTTGALSGSNQSLPSTATIVADAGAGNLAAGGFAVAFQNGSLAHVQVYDASGAAVGAEIPLVSATSPNQSNVEITGLAGGGFVAVWDNGEIFAQVFSGDGTAVGTTFQVNTETSGSQTLPAVTGTPDGGFTVTWQSATSGSSGDGSSNGIIARSFDAAGTATTGEVIVNEETAGSQTAPTIAVLPDGTLATVWTSATSGASGDGDGTGVFLRILGDPNTFVPSSAGPEIEAFSTTRVLSEADLNAGPQRIDIDGAAAFSDADSSDFGGGCLTLGRIAQNVDDDDFDPQDAEEQDQLGLDTSGPLSVLGSSVDLNGTVIGTVQSDGSNGSPLVIDLNANADRAAVEVLLENLTYANTSDDPREETVLSLLVEDGDGGASNPVAITIEITPETDGEGPIRGEVQVNTVATSTQADSAIAGLADGGYISVWTSTNQDNQGDNDLGVFAQRYDANGAVVGGEFQVNSSVNNSQFDASVAGLNDGGFVIVWDDDTVDSIRLNRYDAAGNLTITEQVVPTALGGSQFQPDVTALSNGGYVVTWTNNSTADGDGSSNAVKAQVFNAAGALVGGELLVNEQTIGAQDTASVAALSGGRFVVVWEENDVANGDGSSVSVSARIFGANGVPEGGEFQVNTFTDNSQSEPQVAGLANGDFVAVWRSEGQDGSSGGIFAQRFTDQGVAVGEEFRVNDYTPGTERDPQIIGLDTGGFVIAWEADTLVGSGTDVIAQAFDADGTRIDGEVLVNSGVLSTQDEIALAALPSGNYVIQWTSDTNGETGDGSGDGIFKQIFGDPNEISASQAPVVRGLDTAVALTEAEANAGALLFEAGAVSLLDLDSPDLDGGQIRLVRVVTDNLQDEFIAPDDGTQDSLFFAVGGSVTQVGSSLLVDGTPVATIVSNGLSGADLVVDLVAGATLDAVETLISALTYSNASDDPRDSRTFSLTIEDGDGGATTPFVFTVGLTESVDATDVAKVGDETQVNSFTTGNQTDPSVATLADGGWVVAWSSDDQDGSGTGVYLQRYSDTGNRLGNEVQVADTTLAAQGDPEVSALNGGGYVVVWEGSGAGDSAGVFATIYDAAGAVVASEVLVNTGTSSSQFDPAVAALDTGGFVVTYTTNTSAGDGSGEGVLFQRFDASGVPQGSETVANIETTSSQNASDVTVLDDGRIAIVWVSASSGSAGDGSSSGVFAAIYNADGTLDTGEIAVNQVTINGQNNPVIEATPDGGFIIAWEDPSNGLDGSGASVRARQFDSTGAPATDAFVVNDITSSTQDRPDVTVLSDGRYVISYSDSGSADGSGTGVFAQLYSATGARIDAPMQLNTEFSSTQTDSVLAALPDGGLVAVWQSNTSGTAGDGSGTGIFQQIIGDPADFDLNTAPKIEGVTGTRTVSETDANAGLVALEADRSIALGDLDATDFDGGVLTVQVDISFNLLDQVAGVDGVAQDVFGILSGDVGNGDVQVVGTDVRVDGVSIGTINSTVPLEVVFNANSTVESVEAVLGNLGYSTPSDAPNLDRRVKIELTDGTGQAAQDQFIDLTVTPDQDSTLTPNDEQRVNAFTESAQSFPSVAELTGGGHVVIWQSFNQDALNTNATDGVFAQLYDASGVPTGPEFRVNTEVLNTQGDANVAATADGGFVVVYETVNFDNPGDFDFGIAAQRYDASGNAVGGEFVVNTSTASSQFDPDVAAFEDGGFVVVWVSDIGDANGDAIRAQRFDAAGVAVGAEEVVNTVQDQSNQSQPAVTTLVDALGNNAGYAVVFTGPTSGGDGDGDSNAVYLRIYDATGSATGPEVQVNTSTSGAQDDADITGLTGGGFVVTWRDAEADGSSNGVFAQIYDVAGSPVGGEFRVNGDVLNSESDSSISATADGGFVVSWTAGSAQDGSSDGVFAQRYDATGVKIDGEFRVNQEVSSTQNQSQALGRADGSLLFVWAAQTSAGSGDGSSTGIYQRSFTDTPQVDTSPVLIDTDRAISIGADDVTGGASVLLDDGVSLTDPDGGDFDGGALRVYYTAGDTAQDQLSVLANGDVTLSGSDVLVGGVTVGTIDGTENGANGAALSIALNANADAASVARVLESVAFGFSGTSGELQFTSRGIGFTITDGDGGQTQPDSVFVNISSGSVAQSFRLSDFGENENLQGADLGTFAETALLAGPVRFDAHVDLDNPAVASFNNGFAQIRNDSGTQQVDIFSVADQGTGTGQIGFDGTTVTYEGIAIGTVNGSQTGQNGQNLRIDLNGSATTEAVEALVEAFTYQITASTNRDSQFIGVTVQATGASGSASSIMHLNRDVVAVADATGEDEQVNLFIQNDQQDPSIAELSGGGYVVTWTSTGQDNPNSSNTGIFAQVYNEFGRKVGTEFQVNDIPFNAQTDSHVIGLSTGGFVVTWTDSNVVRDGSGSAVVAQVFDASGAAVGTSIVVNEETSSTQSGGEVVALDAGRFLVVWNSQTSGSAGDGSGFGIYGRVYAADGTPEAGEFQINASTSSDQSLPTAITLPNGDVMVVWQDLGGVDGNSTGIFAQRVDSTGALVSFDGLSAGVDEQQINTTTNGSQSNPDVALLAPSASLPSGGFVVVWQGPGTSGTDIFGQVYDVDGVAQGVEFQVNLSSTAEQTEPRVTGTPDGGFSVVWRDDSGIDGSSQGVVAQSFNADGSRDGAAFVVNTEFSSTQFEPDLVALDNGTLAIVWAAFTSGTSGDGSQYGVFQKLFNEPALPAGAISPTLDGFDAEITLSEQEINGGLQRLVTDGALSLVDVDSANFDGGAIFADQIVGSGDVLGQQLGAADGEAQDQLGLVIGNGVTITGADVRVDNIVIGTIVSDGTQGAAFEVALNANATPELVERAIGQLGYGNSSNNPDASRQIAVQVRDGDGGSAETEIVSVTILPETDRVALPSGDEEQVNTFTPGGQNNPEVAEVYDSLGNQTGYVVVWQSDNQDRLQDNNTGVFAQIYDLDGEPVGGEILVNENTALAQSLPFVTGLPTGGFAVGWTDGNGSDAAMRIFDETGAPVTGDIQVNETTPGSQNVTGIDAQSDGTIRVVYSDNNSLDGNGVGVFQRAFDASGTALTLGTQVNTEFSSTQNQGEIAVLSDDRYVITWTSNTSGTAGDGSGTGIFAQIFAANGTPIGTEFGVNTVTAGGQADPSIAALDDGGFVIVWTDQNSLDGSVWSTQMQRYDASGAAVGPQLRVNETTVNSQYQAEVIALDTGGWLVTWMDDNGTDGSGLGIFAQLYAADGTRIDGQFQVNTETSSSQQLPVAVALPGGDFTIVWQSNTSGTAGDGSGTGVFKQDFSTGAASVSEDPILVGIPSAVTFDEADLNTTPQLLAPNVGVGDLDSSDFDGGRLIVSMVLNDLVQTQFPGQDGPAQDQLGLDTSGVVTLAGTSVQVSGTTIGELQSDGADGAPLVVALNANASPANLELLIEALTYANTSNDPVTDRLVAIQLTDGDGGSVRNVIDVAITEETDGSVQIGGEVRTNSFTIGEQTDSDVASLSDGGYVIVWTSINQDATGDNNTGVFLQRYDAAGAPVGGEIQVNTTAAFAQQDASVIGLSTGGFVVAWEDNSGALSPNSDQEIIFQVFDANGQKAGGEVLVDSTTEFDPNDPALAAFDNGNFVVVAAARENANSQFKLIGQIYDSNGGQVGTGFEVPTTGNTIGLPSVATQSDGTFAVVYQEFGIDDPFANNNGVFLQRFAADGTAIGGAVTVNTITENEQNDASITALDGGGYVVVYTSFFGDDTNASNYGVYGQVFDALGNKVGVEFLVNDVVDSFQYEPDVVALEGGGFAVAYRDDNGTDGSSTGVFVQQYDASGNRVDGALQVNEEFLSAQFSPAMAALPGGNFVVSYTSNTNGTTGDGSGNGIFHRIIGDPADFSLGGEPVLDGVNAEVFYDENTVNGIPQLIDANGAVAVSDPDSADFDGGSILVSNLVASAPLIDQINPPDDLTQDQLGLRQANGITISGSTVSVDGTAVGTIAQDGLSGTPFELTLNANATAEIVELLVENLTYRNISDDPLEVRQLRIQVTDGDGGASVPVTVTLNIVPTPDAAVPVGGERVVNTSAGTSDSPSVTTLPGTDGDFIVVWENNSADGSGEGVFAQRFDSLGNPVARDGTGLPDGVTDEFQINTTTVNSQFDPRVEAYADGSWIVVWSDNVADGSSTGIFQQRFNADGTPNGGEAQVNTLTSSEQSEPDVAVLTDGSTVVVFRALTSAGSGDGSSYGISARIYDPSGAAVGSEFVVNTETSGNQLAPKVTALDTGGFVVTYTSATSGSAGDGAGTGVFAQVFDGAGNPVGGEFQVNTTVNGEQTQPEVIQLENGNLVFVWNDGGADLSGQGIFAQIYGTNGAAVTEEFRVNDERFTTQADPEIAALDTGGFVITWADSSGADGSGVGVFAQQYDSTGARLDSQVQVNTTFSSTQDQPTISALPGGGFVIAFNGSASDGEILLQVYGNDAPTVSPVSANGDEDTAIVLDAAIFDAGFVDPDGNTLQEIRIESFPDNGILALNGTPVTAGLIISRADLLAGNLVYTGAQDFNGPDSFLWSGSDGISFSNEIVEANITVNPVNDAPGLDVGADTTLGEGQPLSRTITLSDPDTDTRSFTIDYGDGTSDGFNSSNLSQLLNKSYASEGSFTVTITVDDNAGEANSVETDSFVVTVENADPNPVGDSVFVDEDGPAQSGNVLTNDSDPGNDPLTVTAVNGEASDVGVTITLTSGALLTLNSDGSFDYDPNGAFESLSEFQSDTDSFTYEVSDGDGGSATATVNVFINGQNDAPDAQDDTASANNTDPVTGNVLTNDTDPDAGDTLEVTEVNGEEGDVGTQITLGSGAHLTLNADGSFDYDPNGAFPGGGSDSFDYTISDGQGGTDTATVTINLNSTNQSPIAQDDDIAGQEESVSNGDLFADNGNGVDSDPDGDPITITEVDGSSANVGAALALSGGGLITVNADGSYSFDPNNAYESLGVGETAVETFTYTIEDGQGGSNQATVTLTIAGENDGPVAIVDTDITDEETATSGDVLTNDTDVDGDALSVTSVGGSELAIGVAVLGSQGGTFTIQSDGSYTYDPNGMLEFLDDGESTTDSITYEADDGNGGTSTASLNVTVTGVNDAPVAEDDDFTVSESGSVSGNLRDDNGNGADSDPDISDIGTITEVNGSAANIGSQITLTSGALLVVNGSGTFTYDTNGAFTTLNTGETATETFTYTLTDDSGVSDTATVTFTIEGNSSGPAAADDSVNTDEDSLVSGNVLTNDSDDDGDPLVVSAVNGAAADVGVEVTLTSGALLTLNADGTFDYDPNGAFESLSVGESTTDSFTYEISDGNGGADTATVTVNIAGANDAPDARNDVLSVSEDAPGADNLLANNGSGADSDVDSLDALTVSEVNGSGANVGGPINLPSGAILTVNSDGSVIYDPNGAFEALGVGETANDSFTYTVDDGNGGTDTADVTVVVSGANDAPVAADDALATAVSVVLNGNVLDDNGAGADSDPDANDVLSVVEVNGATASVGTQITLASGALLTLNADGTFAYDDNGAFGALGSGATATDSFGYTISDSNGGSDTATATITIGGDNLPPVAVDDPVTTDEDTAVSGSVLANDSDPNGDALNVTALDGEAADVGVEVTLASGALLTLNADGTFDYDPNGAFETLAAGDSASDSFAYTISDGNGGADTATVTVSIDGVNDAPTVDGPITVTSFFEDGAQFATDMLLGADDVDDSAVLSVANVLGLTPFITLSGTTLTFDPAAPELQSLAAGQQQDFVVSYDVVDGLGDSVAQTVTYTITGVNDDPTVAGPVTGTAIEDGASVTLDLLAGASDVDTGDVLSVANVDLLPGMTLAGAQLTVDPTDAAFQSIPEGEVRDFVVTYDVVDNNGGSVAQTAVVSVTGVNDAPTVSGPITVTSFFEDGAQFDTDMLLGADDVDDGAVLSVANVVGLTPFISLTGTTLTFDPAAPELQSLAAGQQQDFVVSYDVVDGLGGSVAQTVTYTITGANDAPVAADDALATAVSVVLNGNVLDDNGAGADSDPDANDVLSVVEVNGATASVGTQITLASGALLTLNADGTFAYDDNGAFGALGSGATATDSFVYTISDSNGGSDTATATITIGGDNLPPVAVDDPVTTDEDTAVSGSVLANDSDPNGDALNVTAVNGMAADVGVEVTLASGALLTLNADGTFDYDPNGAFESLAAGDSASDSFAYTISDGNGGSDTATVTVSIDGVNDAPVALDDDVSTDEDTAILGDVLTNDSDVDGDPLSVSAVNGAAASVGTQVTLASGVLLTLNADGTFDYDLNGAFESLAAGDSASDSFAYTISDGNGGSDTATVTVSIDGENDAPVVTSPNTFEVLENTTAVGIVSATDVDASDTLEFSIEGGADAGLFQIDPNSGALSFIAAPDFESPADAGGDNVYDVQIGVSDGIATVLQDIAVDVTDDPEGGRIILTGTDQFDFLNGSEADEIFRPLGGRIDRSSSGGGSDIFEFGDETSNGTREIDFIVGFGSDDFLDIGDANIVVEINRPNATYLVLDGDFDVIVLRGVSDFDPETQLL